MQVSLKLSSRLRCGGIPLNQAITKTLLQHHQSPISSFPFSCGPLRNSGVLNSNAMTNAKKNKRKMDPGLNMFHDTVSFD
jgi:hypothetical protein